MEVIVLVETAVLAKSMEQNANVGKMASYARALASQNATLKQINKSY